MITGIHIVLLILSRWDKETAIVVAFERVPHDGPEITYILVAGARSGLMLPFGEPATSAVLRLARWMQMELGM